jgi:anti-sigma factor RsiW
MAQTRTTKPAMSYEPNNHDDFSELLSAYLDGELTAEEQALVERRLGDSAEFRQLHDELRALRAGLQALPRQQLDADFAESVVRRAERSRLATPALKPAMPYADEPVSRAEMPTARERIQRGLRAFRWSIVAIAVALLIMIFNRDEQQEEANVALVQDAARKDETNHEDSGDGVMMAAPAEMEALKRKANSRELTRDQSEADAVLAAPASAPAADILAGKPAAAMTADSAADKHPETGQSAQSVGGGVGSRAMPSRTAKSHRYAAPEKQHAFFQKNDRLQSAQQALLKLDTTFDDVLIVRCDISPQAAKSRAFERLLADQHIDLVTSDSPKKQRARDARQDLAGPGEATGADEKSSAENAAADDATQPPEAFFVEASPAQIAATLAELQSRSNEFLVLSFQSPKANGIAGELAESTIDRAGSKLRAAEPAAPSADAFAADEQTETTQSQSRLSGGRSNKESAKDSGSLSRGRAVRVPDGSRRLQEILPEAIVMESDADTTTGRESLQRPSVAAPVEGLSARRLEAKKAETAEPSGVGTQSIGEDQSAPEASTTRGATQLEQGAAQVAKAPGAAPTRRVLFLLRVVPPAESSR